MSERNEKVTLYAVETSRFKGGDVSGSLITVAGETLYGHMSSSPEFLRADLTTNFGRSEALRERFGEYEVRYVSLDDDLPPEIQHVFNTGGVADES